MSLAVASCRVPKLLTEIVDKEVDCQMHLKEKVDSATLHRGRIKTAVESQIEDIKITFPAFKTVSGQQAACI